jgi:hypothetical protein
MRKAGILPFFLLLFLLWVEGLNAQPNTLYFMKGIAQTKDLNPSRPGIERGFYIGLPLFSKFDFSVNTNNWSYNDLIHRGSGTLSDSLVWDFNKFLSSLDKNNFAMESAALTLVDIGWKRGKQFYGFSWSEREFSEPVFTKSLVNLMYYGNVPFLGSTYHSGYFGVRGAHYREFAFTYANEISSKLSVGITGKLLFGMAGIKTAGLNFVAGMPKSGDEIDLAAGGKAFVSAPVDIRLINDRGYKLYAKDYFDLPTYLTNFGNPGLAVDIGLTNKVSENFEFSVSLIDLGFISWKQDVTVLTERGHLLFEGINLNAQTPTNHPPSATDVKGLFLAVRDTLRATFLPFESNSSFTTLLPVKLYAAGEFQLNEDFSLGGLLRIRMLNNLLHTSFTASANARLTEKLAFSASYAVIESTFDNLGLGANFRIGKVQLYAVTDNIVSFFRPSQACNSNLRLGINMIFQEEARRRKGVYGR